MWTPQQGCTRKRAYLTKREAKQANATLCSKERTHGRQPTHIYLCPKAWGGCGAWHLGHAGETWRW